MRTRSERDRAVLKRARDIASTYRLLAKGETNPLRRGWQVREAKKAERRAEKVARMIKKEENNG